MNEEGHRQALEELRASRGQLDPVRDLRLFSEASHGMAAHAIAAGFWRHLGVDCDQHQMMTRRLRESGYPEIASAFGQLEEIRTGRWYGRQRNGDIAHKLNELLAEIEKWSLG